MFDTLLVHPTTRFMLEAYAKQPPQGMLLVGPEGVGKLTLANRWAAAVSDHHGEAVTVVAPDEKGSISIETVRGLYRTARSKRAERQVIIIDHAEVMSSEAQNAFLKLLEEPRAGVTFILTAPLHEALLPTILSRLQVVPVQPVADESLREFLAQQNIALPAKDLLQLLFIARGRPATAMRLQTDPTVFGDERSLMQQAKELLTAPRYTRLAGIPALSANREQCVATLQAMQRIVALQLLKAPGTSRLSQSVQLAEALDSTLRALDNNGNAKAQLMHLFMQY